MPGVRGRRASGRSCTAARPARPAGVGDPRLGAVDHVAAVVAVWRPCACACRSQPPSGSVSAIVARSSPVAMSGRYRCALLLGAEAQRAAWTRPSARRTRRRGSSSPRASSSVTQGVAGGRHPGVAVRLGDGEPVDARALHLLDERPRDRCWRARARGRRGGPSRRRTGRPARRSRPRPRASPAMLSRPERRPCPTACGRRGPAAPAPRPRTRTADRAAA